MKIKFDENLPEIVAELLENLGHEVHTVLIEGLHGRSDRVIWHAAQAESRFLITQDLDFSNIHQFSPGTTPEFSLFAYTCRAGRILSPPLRIIFGLRMLSNGQVVS